MVHFLINVPSYSLLLLSVYKELGGFVMDEMNQQEIITSSCKDWMIILCMDLLFCFCIAFFHIFVYGWYLAGLLFFLAGIANLLNEMKLFDRRGIKILRGKEVWSDLKNTFVMIFAVIPMLIMATTSKMDNDFPVLLKLGVLLAFFCLGILFLMPLASLFRKIGKK